MCALIEGTPETSFPLALTEQGREPLAANLHPKHFRLGSLQLSASILGVGLDDLVQRQARQRRIRQYAITTASLVFSAIMGVSTWNAVQARNDAQLSRSAAESSRNEAERLVEFMLSDLSEDLEALGRLDIIDNVGDQVGAYYDTIPLSDMNNEHLARRSRSMHLLGQVAISQGKSEQALGELIEARVVTAELLRRAPNDPMAIYAHAQSEYSLLRVHQSKNPERAIEFGLSYKALSKRLYDADKSNLEYIDEYGWACNKLGQIFQNLNEQEKAKTEFTIAANLYRAASAAFPQNDELKFNLITFERNLALIEHEMGHHEIAVNGLRVQVKNLENLLNRDPKNFKYRTSLNLSNLWIQNIQISNMKLCKAEQIYDLAADIEDLIEHDPSNQYWKSDYIKFAATSIKTCKNLLSDSWIAHSVDFSGKVYNMLSAKNTQLTEQISWLEGQYSKKPAVRLRD